MRRKTLFFTCLVFSINLSAQQSYLDTIFGDSGICLEDSLSSQFYSVLISNDGSGRILASGDYQSKLAIFAYTSGGSKDTTWGNHGMSTITFPNHGNSVARKVLQQNDGKLITVGDMRFSGSLNNSNLLVTRFNNDGNIDSSFANNGILIIDHFLYETGYSGVITNDNKIILSASGGDHASIWNWEIIRINGNGSIDSTFASDGLKYVEITNTGEFYHQDLAHDILLQDDGKFIVSGKANNLDTGPDFTLGRFFSDGNLDSTFGTDGIVFTTFENSFAELIYSSKLQPDGKIVVGGFACTEFDKPRLAFARYNTNGTLDLSFGNNGTTFISNSSSNLADMVYAIALQTDGKIVFSGAKNINNQLYKTELVVGRLLSNGQLDSGFVDSGMSILMADSISDNFYQAICVQEDQKIVAAGRFDWWPMKGILVRYKSSGDPTSSLAQQNQNLLIEKIYPNPLTSNELSINLKLIEAEELSISLSDLSGRTIDCLSAINKQNDQDTIVIKIPENILNGYYSLLIRNAKMIFNYQLLINR